LFVIILRTVRNPIINGTYNLVSEKIFTTKFYWLNLWCLAENNGKNVIFIYWSKGWYELGIGIKY
jgi:hypothetical protein